MVFLVAPRGAQEPRQQWPRWRKVTMPKLSLMFDNKLVREVPVGSRPVTIGRAPDNDLSVDNLAVSSYHAKVYFEEIGRASCRERVLMRDVNESLSEIRV